MVTSLQKLKEFRDYLLQIGSESTSEEELEQLYNETVSIVFNDRVITTNFCSEVYLSLLSLVENLIKEY